MKFSEYPVGAVIEIEDAGRYEKGVDNIWHATNRENDTYSSDYIETELSRVKDVSMPWGVVAQLVMMLQDEYGHVDAEGEDITFDRVFTDAVEEHNSFLEREAQKTGN